MIYFSVPFFCIYYFLAIFADNMQRVYNILVGILGESKQGHYDRQCSQYQFNCPNCRDYNGGIPDNKYNLEISLALGKYHCWKCDIKGPLSYLIRKYGGNEAFNNYKFLINDIRESSYYDLSSFKDNPANLDNYLRLPITFKKIDGFAPRKLLDYMEKRNIGLDLVEKYNLGYTTWDEQNWQMRNRLVIPSYDAFGDLNYWSSRDYTGYERKTKYRNCDEDKKEIIFNEGMIQWDADIYLCEGIIDSITYENAVPLMGKILLKNSLLYKKLFEKANADIVICLDSDTEIEETKKIYRMLDTGRLRNHIKYVRMGTKELPYKDFGEIYEQSGKKGMIKMMRTVKRFTETELMLR